jgi:hypothetical protein
MSDGTMEPRALTEREKGWISDILGTNDEWREADIGGIQVLAEERGEEGVSFILKAPEPENPKAKSRRESVGELWIQTEDGCSINVQLSQFEGRLRELYVLFVDPKNLTRTLPETWNEVSREAANV